MPEITVARVEVCETCSGKHSTLCLGCGGLGVKVLGGPFVLTMTRRVGSVIRTADAAEVDPIEFLEVRPVWKVWTFEEPAGVFKAAAWDALPRKTKVAFLKGEDRPK